MFSISSQGGNVCITSTANVHVLRLKRPKYVVDLGPDWFQNFIYGQIQSSIILGKIVIKHRRLNEIKENYDLLFDFSQIKLVKYAKRTQVLNNSSDFLLFNYGNDAAPLTGAQPAQRPHLNYSYNATKNVDGGGLF